jgi:hypothetical protein
VTVQQPTLTLSWADSEIRRAVLVPGLQSASVVIQWSAASVVRQAALDAHAHAHHGQGVVEHGFMSGLELGGQWASGHAPQVLPVLLGRVKAGRLQCEGVWWSRLPVPWHSPTGAPVLLELHLANGVDCVWPLHDVYLRPTAGVACAFLASLAC